MPYDHHICRPPTQGGIAYVEPAKRLQQWIQGRARDGRGDHPVAAVRGRGSEH